MLAVLYSTMKYTDSVGSEDFHEGMQGVLGAIKRF